MATLAIALTLVVGAVSSCASDGSDDGGASPMLQPVRPGAPALPVDDLPGPLMINVWATWCAPCRKELPDLQRVHDSLGEGVRLVGVNVGEDAPTVQSFVDELGVTFDQYLDPDGELQVALGITGLPATAVVDASGRVVSVHQGVLDEAGFRTLLAQVRPSPSG